MPKQLIDLTGMRFGRLTVLRKDGNCKSGNAKWLCLCDCGALKSIKGISMRKGITLSCGCYQKEQARKYSNTFTTKHGHSREKLFHIWINILHRCYNPHSTSYKNYGKRGIKVCDEWHDYETFKKWALDNGYTQGLSIDRIDVNGNYCPDNCKYSTPKEQANNKRNNHLVEIDGVTKTISQWADFSNLPYSLVYQRVRLGFTGKDIIKPKRGEKHDCQD